MFLHVIWNKNLKQTSLLVSPTDSFKDFPVIISFDLKEDIDTAFIQNFIANEEFQFLYIEDGYFWLENFHLTKNILAFLNAIDFIDLNPKDFIIFNQFILKNKLSINDFDNLGFQSPVKTIPRDLSTKPYFMSSFLDVGDFSKRLLRTTFSFENNRISITVNKRMISSQQFFNHLNSDRDRFRIKESLAFPFENKSQFVEFISSLSFFSDSVNISDDSFDTQTISEKNLIKENSFAIPSILFLNSVNLFEGTKTNDKLNQVLEDFSPDSVDTLSDNVLGDELASNYPSGIPYTEGYDNSVYIEESIPENKFVENEVIDELTEDFLVEIEMNLEQHEKSIQTNQIPNNHEDTETIQEYSSENSTVSVDDLVDSINNIFPEPSYNLELVDIIELPIIFFLSDHNKEKISELLLDSYFVNHNVNEEIKNIPAEDILNVVKKEVSIFENTVSNPETIINVINHEEKISTDSSIIDTPALTKNDFILEKNNTEKLHIYSIIKFLEIKKSLTIEHIENLIVIDFLISVDFEENKINLEENVDSNFNFIEENKKKLLDLAMLGDIHGIEDLYKNYPEFEKPLINFNYEGDNPLCISSFYENLDLLKKLIDYGWNPNYFDSNLNNALIIACAEGHKHIVRYLLTQDVQINFQNKIGYTALHFAVNDCNHRIVKLLLEAGADVEITDNDRNTPLSIAAFKGDINSTKLLLQTRINVHTKNKKGYDARSIALIAKNHAVAKLIEDKIISEKHNHSLPPIIEKNV